MWRMAWFPEYYFHLHSNDVVFFDTYRLNSRDKAISALVANFLLTAINVYVRRTVSSWQINYINSPHIPRSELQSSVHIQLTILFYTLFVCLSGAINIFLIFSNFWFLIAQTTSTVLVTMITTQIFLREKALAETFRLSEEPDRAAMIAEPSENARPLEKRSTSVRANAIPDISWIPSVDESLVARMARSSNENASSIRRGVLHI
ncbi:hypothetical protein CYMTET_16356 [Cymbomonas tetramitiformis]|uniref:Uncharacterized protein n=1 Tax=Cymbomonas tetramitiformis TaxID=36881 RepID=A0AAE0GC65_9CHLO|nr:hypothetical protein CYMTET_47282 [Cymbomonas tetramitiformis]KAK3249547.1 hypothetical protein CYMTET_41026 [Cymbomonas tetramitiformis]KAK3249573.1 hypothetical protein CYMTET_41019 [Cymbomonas tetramitiformis]KAK3275515.1 hypothetical protein CYMTET_16356 [Cymbomonas tetramitiformis]